MYFLRNFVGSKNDFVVFFMYFDRKIAGPGDVKKTCVRRDFAGTDLVSETLTAVLVFSSKHPTSYVPS